MKKKVKILHTADWHLGLVSWRSRREVDRGEEQKEALEQLTEVAEKEKVDLIIHAGDLFHNPHRPDKKTIQLAVDTILHLIEIAPFVWVMGNHDWYAMEVLQKVFPPRVYIIRDYTPREIEDVPVTVFPLPYVSLPRLLGDYRGEEIQDQARELLRRRMERWEGSFRPDRWNILVAHVTIEELVHYAEVSYHREVFLKKADIPSAFNYGALGHLHTFSFLPAPCPLYYPSSLVVDSFERVGKEGSFLLVKLEEGEKSKVEPYFLSGAHLWNWEVKGEKSIEEIYEEISQNMEGKRNYIRLRLREDFYTPALANKLKEMEGENWQVVTVEIIPREKKAVEEDSLPVNEDSIPQLFSRYCQEQGLSEEVVKLFYRYYQEAGEVSETP
ncbi:MAG TPA: DNA repair exonuclease [Candidatus Atribacteria bacterium]|nr:DNA repair exonuclease [Candidatus Atribacteria bacterium]HPZ81750.1 DNA repair exonuclease [Candidatus Atribacteria bacterium]HQE24593.1 DNA repair exonuclease [Candidatus Atribacteria bacterium]